LCENGKITDEEIGEIELDGDSYGDLENEELRGINPFDPFPESITKKIKGYVKEQGWDEE